jgi:IS5 family transposase
LEVAINQRSGFTRKAVATHGARHDGSQLREVVTTNNTASDVWADTTSRFKTNEAWLAANGRINRKKQKAHMGFFVRTILIKRAETKIMLANLAYNMQHLIFHESRLATG